MNKTLVISTLVTASVTLLGFQAPSLASSFHGYFDWTAEDNPGFTGRATFKLEDGVEIDGGFEGTAGSIQNAPRDAFGEVFEVAEIISWSKIFVPIDTDNDGIDDGFQKLVNFKYGIEEDENGTNDPIITPWDEPRILMDENDDFIEGEITNVENGEVIAIITDAVHTIPEPNSISSLLTFGTLGIGLAIKRKQKNQP